MLLRKPPNMPWPRFLVGFLVPYSIGIMIADIVHRRDRDTDSALALQREYEAAIVSRSYSYEAAVRHLVGRGLPEDEVRGGSMPEPSLIRCGELLGERLDLTRPITVLHVGNFVGVSLSWFADLVRGWAPGSRVVGIDPNVVHRGIQRPQEHVISLLRTFGLETEVLLVTGYTLRKNVGDFPPGDQRGGFQRDESCENALGHLAGLAAGQVDVALMDGNHEATYLHRELEEVRRLLAPSGLLVLDDVFDWRSLAPIARELEDSPDAALLDRDHRFGIWQLR